MLLPENIAAEWAAAGSADRPPLSKTRSKQPDAGYVPIGPARPQGSAPEIVAFFEHPGAAVAL